MEVTRTMSRLIEGEVKQGSILCDALLSLLEDDKLGMNEVFAIARACKYADQIDDISIGGVWKEELRRIQR